MSLLAKKKIGKVLTGDTFQYSLEAKKAKESFDDVINSTVGALFDDDKAFYEYKTVTHVIKKIPADIHYSYAPTSGGDLFGHRIKKWVFGPYQSTVENAFYHDVVATPGASGALYNSFMDYMDHDDHLIMPDIYWTNYLVMLDNVGAKHVTYPMFDGNHFNVDGFIKTCEKVIETKKKLICLFNDPCNNPTGYSIKPSEWQQIYTYLNEKQESGIDVIMIYDLAYLDYEGTSYEDSRKAFESLNHITSKLLLIFAFSASKSFSLYGIRGGAQIAISKNQEAIEQFKKVSIFSARATWSCPPSTAIHMVNTLFGDEGLTQKFTKELDQAKAMVKKRADLFLDEAKTSGLKHYPYDGGFFITLPVKDPEKAFKELAAIHLYGIPVPRGLRLAVSSMTYDDIKGMAGRIKEVLTQN
ncbi:MAG: pyridoxal phosphate-dependent aminotransferase [Acholeplasmataceae bacterium]